MLIRETARRVARYEWLEDRLFAIVGAWSLEPGDADAGRLFAAAAHRHAWHARLWAERRPVLHDLDPTTMAVPPALVAAIDVLATSDPASRLAVYDDALGALLEVYLAHLEAAVAVSDAPVMRALRLAVTDANEDRQAARALLAGRTRRSAADERAAARRPSLAELLVQVG